MDVRSYLKAITGALVAGLSSLVTGLSDDHLSTQEWLIAIVAALVALGAVWAVPNIRSNQQ